METYIRRVHENVSKKLRLLCFPVILIQTLTGQLLTVNINSRLSNWVSILDIVAMIVIWECKRQRHPNYCEFEISLFYLVSAKWAFFWNINWIFGWKNLDKKWTSPVLLMLTDWKSYQYCVIWHCKILWDIFSHGIFTVGITSVHGILLTLVRK